MGIPPTDSQFFDLSFFFSICFSWKLQFSRTSGLNCLILEVLHGGPPTCHSQILSSGIFFILIYLLKILALQLKLLRFFPISMGAF